MSIVYILDFSMEKIEIFVLLGVKKAENRLIHLIVMKFYGSCEFSVPVFAILKEITFKI